MFIVKNTASAETRVKNSRFLAEVFTVNSPEEAKEAWRFRKDTPSENRFCPGRQW